MALPAMRTHQIQGALVENIQALVYTNGQTFLNGAVLVFSSGTVSEAGANPATGTIVGVALQNAGSNPGYDVANASITNTYTGRNQTVSVSRPSDSIIYAAGFTNNSSTLIAPAQTDVGVQYGITAYSGVWTVDKNKTTTNARVVITGFDIAQLMVFFKFIPSYLA